MTLSNVLIVLMVLSPFSDLLGFVMALEGLFGLCQQFLFALAADGVGDGEGGIFHLLDPHEFPAPCANDFQKHGSPPFSGHKKSPQRKSPWRLFVPTGFTFLVSLLPFPR
jgi:hypothetical protein